MNTVAHAHGICRHNKYCDYNLNELYRHPLCHLHSIQLLKITTKYGKATDISRSVYHSICFLTRAAYYIILYKLTSFNVNII